MSFLDDLPDLGFKGPPRRPRGRPAPDIDCVEWLSVHCPQCGSPDCPVIDSRQKPVRWHECRNADCPGRTAAGGYRFKSIEKNYRPAAGGD